MSDPRIYECETCKGFGGWDVADDCEVSDEWVECVSCDGTGEVSDD